MIDCNWSWNLKWQNKNVCPSGLQQLSPVSQLGILSSVRAENFESLAIAIPSIYTFTKYLTVFLAVFDSFSFCSRLCTTQPPFSVGRILFFLFSIFFFFCFHLYTCRVGYQVIDARADNLVPALTSTTKHYFYFWARFSAQQKPHFFEHLLGKRALFRNIIGTNSENSHFF